MKTIVILGSGFSSLTAACYLAKAGYTVKVLEKNAAPGGRASQYSRDGFTFDIGPTWYWMPDVFESFFNDFGFTTEDFYELHKLGPAYRVVFGENDFVDIADNLTETAEQFEKMENGAGDALLKFMHGAEQNYKIAIGNLVYKPADSILELVNFNTLKRLPLFFKSIRKQISSYFKNPKLKQMLEFPVLFLGAKPQNIPAFYNFMNFADYGLGTYYPEKGMYTVANAFYRLAKELGVQFYFEHEVTNIEVEDNLAFGVNTKHGFFAADVVLSGADYHHTESLLPKDKRNYNEEYWEKKTFSPSALLFFVGFNKKLENVMHHTLFFDTSFETHAAAIYDSKSWPEKPLFYASFPSLTDATCAPEKKEAGIFLIPLAPGLEDTEETRKKYLNEMMLRFEKLTNQSVQNDILFTKSYCIRDFEKDYHAYKGNAYGLANTLMQTHILRPRLFNKKLRNFYYTGQLTVPGPGVPPAIISGKIIAEKIKKQHTL